MRQIITALMFSLTAFFITPIPASEVPTDPYSVVWETPSSDYNGSMPLGNGEIGLNAWVNPQGELEFFISRTDCWDRVGRLLKIGGVKISTGLELTPEQIRQNFSQKLDTQTGILTIVYGELGNQTRLQVWVDINRPVIVVQIQTDKPSRPKAMANLWRTRPITLHSNASGDLGYGQTITFPPDTILSSDQLSRGQIGWYRDNGSQTPEFLAAAKIQGTDDAPRSNPLQNRVFGAIIQSTGAICTDEKTLSLPEGTEHTIEIAAVTVQPATADQWLTQTKSVLSEAAKKSLQSRQQETVNWWKDFQNRSWIRFTDSQNARPSASFAANNLWTINTLPLNLGQDNAHSSRFTGTFSSASVLRKMENSDQWQTLWESNQPTIQTLDNSVQWTFPAGGCIKTVIVPGTRTNGYERIFDKIAVGGQNGFLVDLSPQGKIRVIHASITRLLDVSLESGKAAELELSWTPKAPFLLKVNGKTVYSTPASSQQPESFVVTQGYALQRFINACAGRGNYPIKYNGSIFTVPFGNQPEYADYRRWGAGYWWQNTRSAYFSMNLAGDFDLQQSFYQMYKQHLKLGLFRTSKYFGQSAVGTAYLPECVFFWGDVAIQAYGSQLWSERTDKLQSSRWHRWEFVGGLELAFMALNTYEFTQDEAFLKETAIPIAEATTRFFDVYYKTDPQTGKLVISPAQAVETWWNCLNPMPEVAGLHAVLQKLLALDSKLTTEQQRAEWKKLLDKIPPIPTWTDPQGVTRTAPGEKFAQKSNIENPELYCVFPFRQISFDKCDAQGNPDERIAFAVNALEKRWDRGAFGWRQDDLFMAYLGLTDQVRDFVVKRAGNKCANQRFSAFWGPNYDWTPDQCHGGVLTAAVQAMVLQTDGDKIFLLPAFPDDWNVDFKLHAPRQTTISGKYENGKLIQLTVQPESRQKDVIFCKPGK